MIGFSPGVTGSPEESRWDRFRSIGQQAREGARSEMAAELFNPANVNGPVGALASMLGNYARFNQPAEGEESPLAKVMAMIGGVK